ncbi:hypothetical protein [uncultured Kordia sp.]|uniref:hypothetical protein n=1 Tax=uncultured Kordia sp. TaxID=507699 RepID=UPI002636E27D|nr:hypothetical protein [uncultured Kordia sp.]
MKPKLFVTSISLLALLFCSAQNHDKKAMTINNSGKSKLEKNHVIQLKKGELFLVLLGNQMAGKEALLQEYFKTVFPPAQKNGLATLGQLPIEKVAVGDFIPNGIVGLFKWPNMESIQAFLKEISQEELTKLRLKIWNELKQHMIVTQVDRTLIFKENKIYEIKVLWNEHKVSSGMIKKHGGTVLINSLVAGYEDLGKNNPPKSLLIIEWDTTQKADAFRKMNFIKSKKEESFYTHFSFPEKG